MMASRAIFSRDIPKLVTTQLQDAASEFLARHGLAIDDIDRFVCHPGGAKVIAALEHAFGLAQGALVEARAVLRDYGNMSATTVMFVLERMLAKARATGATVGAGADECTRARVHGRLSRHRQPVTALYWMLGLVALQRLIELAHARSNTARLRRLGAVEADAGGYPLFVLLHAGWLMSLALFVPAETPPDWLLICLFALLQLGRIWVIVSLGGYWTTRIITVARRTPRANRPIPVFTTPELSAGRRRDRRAAPRFWRRRGRGDILGAQSGAARSTHSHRGARSGAAPRGLKPATRRSRS